MPTGIYERTHLLKGKYIKCAICKKEFYRRPCFNKPRYVKIGFGKYCSNKCRQNGMQGHVPWNKGIKRTDISGKKHYLFGKKLPQYIKDAISKANKGRPAWNKNKKFPQFSGKNHPMFGKHHTAKARKKMSDANQNKNGIKNQNWKGGKIKSKGYVYIYKPEHPYCSNDKYVAEHRLVVEGFIGCYLLSKEPVHHLGKRDDNRPQMLMAFKNHSAHKRFEGKGIIKPEEIIFDGRKLDH